MTDPSNGPLPLPSPELVAKMQFQPILTPYMKRMQKAAEDRGREAERLENVDYLLRLAHALRTQVPDALVTEQIDQEAADAILVAADTVEKAAEDIATRKGQNGG